jgi:mannosyltransferase
MLAIGAAIRWWRIGDESYWFDELCSVLQSRYSLGGLILDLAENDVHAPLYPVLLWLWVRLFGDAEAATRSLSALVGTAAILPMYALGRTLFDRSTALNGAGLLALNAFAVFYARESRPYSLLLLAGLTTTWLLARWASQPQSRGTMWAYAVGGAALAYSHVFGLFLLLAHGVYVFGWVRELRRRFGTVALGIGAVFAPWLPVLTWQAWRVQQDFWIAPLRWTDPFRWLWLWSGFSHHLPILFLALAVLGSLVAARAVRRCPDAARRSRLALLGTCMLVPLLPPVAISIVGQPVFHAKSAIFILGPLLLLAAHGLRGLGSRFTIIVAGPLALLLVGQLAFEVHLVRKKEQWRELAGLARVEAARGTVVTAEGVNKPYFEYYLDDVEVQWLASAVDVVRVERLARDRGSDVLYLQIRRHSEDHAGVLEAQWRRLGEHRLIGGRAVRYRVPGPG